MNVILAVKQNAGAQRDELLAEREQLVKRIAQIGYDLAALDLFELVAAQHQDASTPEVPERAKRAPRGDSGDGAVAPK